MSELYTFAQHIVIFCFGYFACYREMKKTTEENKRLKNFIDGINNNFQLVQKKDKK